jgi:hypothetical protein
MWLYTSWLICVGKRHPVCARSAAEAAVCYTKHKAGCIVLFLFLSTARLPASCLALDERALELSICTALMHILSIFPLFSSLHLFTASKSTESPPSFQPILRTGRQSFGTLPSPIPLILSHHRPRFVQVQDPVSCFGTGIIVFPFA